MSRGRNKRVLKIMVSSTIYHHENDLEQICASLRGWKYEVISSFDGSIYTFGGETNLDACLNAVEECDLFLGIIYPTYGSGITHKEISKAIELDKPRVFLAHHDVVVARKLLEPYMYTDKKKRIKNESFKFEKTSILDKIEVIYMYNEAIQDGKELKDKRRNWVQEFYKTTDILNFIKHQFEDYQKIEKQLNI